MLIFQMTVSSCLSNVKCVYFTIRNSGWGEQWSTVTIKEHTHTHTHRLQTKTVDPCPAQQQLIRGHPLLSDRVCCRCSLFYWILTIFIIQSLHFILASVQY